MCFHAGAELVDNARGYYVVSVWSNALENEVNGYGPTQKVGLDRAKNFIVTKNVNAKADKILAVTHVKGYDFTRVPSTVTI